MLENKPQFDKEEVWRQDRDHQLHPWTDFSTFKDEGSMILSQAEGAYVTDSEGKIYLDGIGGLWCVNIGHGNEEMAETLAEQSRRLAFYNTFTDGALKGRRPSLAEAGTLGARTVLLAAPVWAGRPGLIFYAASPVGHPVRHHLAEWPRELVWEVLFTAEPDPTTGQYVEWSTLANMTDP